ncbi:MAG: tetratricopeptide repeat protein [Gemmatimonadota bacterium]|nr:tetratricopeptide repeat protein [Gemmatimonadota bacterium]
MKQALMVAFILLGLLSHAEALESSPTVPALEDSLYVSADSVATLLAPELHVAAAAMEAGDYPLAAAKLEALTRDDTANVDALRMLASAYLRQEAYASAVPVCERIAALDSTDSGVMVALGFLHGKMGDAERSLAAYRGAIDVDAETVQAYQGLGWIHLQRRELQEAMNMIAKSTELAPEYAPNYVLMGRVLTAQGFYENARQAFQTAFRLDPGLREQYGILLQELVLRHGLGP